MSDGAISTLILEWEDSTRRALDAMARYKFWMFGYHAGRTVYLATLIGRLGGPKLPNPFQALVHEARRMYCRDCGELRAPDHLCTSTSLSWIEPGQLTLPEPAALHREDGADR